MMYYPQPVPQPDYRKLGGWLMFFNVLLIINAASAACGALNTLVSLGTLSSLFRFFPVWYWAVMSVMSIGGILVCVFALLRLHRRNLAGFRLFMMLYFGVYAVNSALVFVVFLLPGHTLGDWMRNIFSLLSYPEAEMQWFMDTMNRAVNSILTLSVVVALIVCVGGGIGTWFYLKRSRRVAVYFDPNYVPPPPVYPPAYGQPPYPGVYYYPSQPQGPYGQWGAPTPPAPPPQG